MSYPLEKLLADFEEKSREERILSEQSRLNGGWFEHKEHAAKGRVYDDAALSLIRAMQADSGVFFGRWFSVLERTPDFFGEVLVLGILQDETKPSAHAAIFQKDHWRSLIWAESNYLRIDSVTHWAEMPKIPDPIAQQLSL